MGMPEPRLASGSVCLWKDSETPPSRAEIKSWEEGLARGRGKERARPSWADLWSDCELGAGWSGSRARGTIPQKKLCAPSEGLRGPSETSPDSWAKTIKGGG